MATRNAPATRVDTKPAESLTLRRKVLKQVTLPVHKLVPGVEYDFKITSPMHVGKKVDDEKAPATLCEAVNMWTGELGLIVCPKVMQNELNENYPGDGYVNKFFCIVKSNVEGKRWKMVTISEVADPSEDIAAILKQRSEAAKQRQTTGADAPAGEGTDENE
jgi:hypothetical protein